MKKATIIKTTLALAALAITPAHGKPECLALLVPEELVTLQEGKPLIKKRKKVYKYTLVFPDMKTLKTIAVPPPPRALFAQESKGNVCVYKINNQIIELQEHSTLWMRLFQ